MGSNDQQVITNDGDGGAYLGLAASTTASTVTLSADPGWNWMGTTNPQAAVIAIAYETGVGQYSFLQGYSGRTISLVSPWKVLPDATSIVVISQYELKYDDRAQYHHKHSGWVDCLRGCAERRDRRQRLDECRPGNPDFSFWTVRSRME
jgi:hypothetical protein